MNSAFRSSVLLAILLPIGCSGETPHAVPTVASESSTLIPAAASECSFGAFVQETDPAGLNVRSGPSIEATIIGTLPPGKAVGDLDGFKLMIEVLILGSTNGWFRVANARDNPELSGQRERSVFSGEGWVSGRKLTVKSQAATGHASPNAESSVVLRSRDGSGFDNDTMVRAGQLIACKADWALVEFSDEALSDDVRESLIISGAARTGSSKRNFRAWLNQICSLQETSCDGLATQLE